MLQIIGGYKFSAKRFKKSSLGSFKCKTSSSTGFESERVFFGGKIIVISKAKILTKFLNSKQFHFTNRQHYVT